MAGGESDQHPQESSKMWEITARDELSRSNVKNNNNNNRVWFHFKSGSRCPALMARGFGKAGTAPKGNFAPNLAQHVRRGRWKCWEVWVWQILLGWCEKG